MQIIIVHPRRGETRLAFTPRLMFGLVAGVVAVMSLGAVLVGAVMAYAPLPAWLGGVSQARQDAFLRQNVNLMARRVGEMQAKIMQLDALGERVAGLAGVSPTFNPKAAPGRGGLLVSPRPLSPEEVSTELDKLQNAVADRTDYMNVLDARLTSLSGLKAMQPTVMPVSQGYDDSSFGWRIDPLTGTRALHEGVDFSAPTGTPIVAAAGGVVVAAEFNSGYGYMVDIDHGNDLVTRYAHASKLLVKPGDLVKRGQRIALVGSTGRSTGAHLHFEVRLSGSAVNPANFLARGQGGLPPQTFARVITLPASNTLD